MTELMVPQERVDAVIGAYLTLRSQKEALTNKYNEDVKALDNRMKKLEAWLHLKMHNDKVNSLSADTGTVYKSTVERATVVDMDAFLDYVKKNDAWHLLERRVSKIGVRNLLDESLPLPDGVNWYTGTTVHVRKPNER